jgi:hypothetical protein
MAKKYKGTLNGEAQVSIGRTNHEMVDIEIRDKNRRDVICVIRMTPAAFGEAITGWARRPGELHFNLDYNPVEDSDNGQVSS